MNILWRKSISYMYQKKIEGKNHHISINRHGPFTNEWRVLDDN
jgi:hypothetical protein